MAALTVTIAGTGLDATRRMLTSVAIDGMEEHGDSKGFNIEFDFVPLG